MAKKKVKKKAKKAIRSLAIRKVELVSHSRITDYKLLLAECQTNQHLFEELTAGRGRIKVMESTYSFPISIGLLLGSREKQLPVLRKYILDAIDSHGADIVEEAIGLLYEELQGKAAAATAEAFDFVKMDAKKGAEDNEVE